VGVSVGGERVSSQEVIDRTVQGLGFDPVACERAGGGLLRVFIDRLDGQTVTIEDCERVTRQLQYVLEVEGVHYERLEVSSPGLDRPLRRPADFERFAGLEVDLVLREPFQGRRKYRGVLQPSTSAGDPGQRDSGLEVAGPERASDGAAGWSIVFTDGGQEQVLGFSLDELREARLVPVIDFKGRRGEGGASPAAVGANEPGTADGGIGGGLKT